jgi:FixJ family two-component response regulator
MEGSPAPDAPLLVEVKPSDVVAGQQPLAEGASNRAIGEALWISERTVENHVLPIVSKLGVESCTAGATFALSHGIS